MRVAIVGAGGHGRVVYDCLQLLYGRDLEAAFFDDDYPRKCEVLGVPVVGLVAELCKDKSFTYAFVAIGDNHRRSELTHMLTKAGKSLLTLVHPHTAVSKYARLGVGTIAVAGTIVNAGAVVGKGVILNTHCSVGHDCVVEDFAQLAPGVNLGGRAIVEEGTFLGIGAKVAPEVRVGAWAVIGAGSVVLKDVPPRVFCHGVPARTVRELKEPRWT